MTSCSGDTLERTEYWKYDTNAREHFCGFRVLVEVGVRPWVVNVNVKQKIEATIELAVSKVINGTIPQRVSLVLLLAIKRVQRPNSRRLALPPFDDLRDEVDAITRWWSKLFFVLIRCFAHWWCEPPQKANKLVVAVPMRTDLAKAFYACLLYNEGASRQVSRLGWKSRMMTARSQGRCHLTNSPYFNLPSWRVRTIPDLIVTPQMYP